MEDESWSKTKEGAYCHVENHQHIVDGRYGFLYNFCAVENIRGLYPSGRHVPSAKEWNELIDFLGGTEVAGGKMKDADSGLWKTRVNNDVSLCGFSALPAGGRGHLGKSHDLGLYATWWSSTSHDELYARHYGLFPDRSGIRFNPGHKASGFSVRCIRD